MIRDDIDKFLAGPKNDDVEFYILSALSDLQRLFQDSLSHKKSKFQYFITISETKISVIC